MAERPAVSKTYVGLEESLALARQTLQEHGPFDGLLGFSQGATLGALLCLAPSSPPLPPLRFAVLVSGFMPRDPALEPLVGTADGPPPLRVPLPSLHVMGEHDELVAAASSRRLSDCFAGATIHSHEGGHLVPSSADFRALLKDFVTRQAAATPAAAAPDAAATAAAATAAAASAAAPAPATGAGGSEAADAALRACLLELRAVAKGTLSFLTDSEEEAAGGVLEQAVLPDQMDLEAEGGGGGGGGDPNPNFNP